MPPLRPHVHAALAVSTYAGRMRITLNAHPLALPAELPAELLGEFAAQIDRSVVQPLDRAA